MTELVEFGWTDHFSQHFAGSGLFSPARVVAEHRDVFRVQTSKGERAARVSGRMRHEADGPSEWPAVGDWVTVQSPGEEGDVTIRGVLPRKSKFSRKVAGDRTDEQIVAANVDTVWIVSSLDQDFSLRRIERYLTLAWESGASPVIVLTKADLSEDILVRISEVESISIGTSVHVTSCLQQEGLDELRTYFDGYATVALLGSSGVGKSTLINALAGSALQDTRDVRSDGKGRHTTTGRQLIRLPCGGLIIDTPGMRELQLWDGQAGLSTTFGDVDEIGQQCRFSDCRHSGEPGCAVAKAVARGQLAEERLLSYQKLQRELAYLERKQDVRAQSEENRRIKNIMKTLRHHPKYKR